MRFLVDQSADARILPHLQQLGHDVTRVARDYLAGLPDHDVLDIAYRERRTLIACDRDFGELVFVRQHRHAGVILLRLGSSPPLELTLARLDEVLARHVADLHRFLVVVPHLIRVR